ncbi:MAG: MotA/TolQ/ExbB proton channel family protein [Phycisphaerales bacterium]
MTQAIEIFRAAGWVAWPLLALSVLSVAVCLERAVYFAMVRREFAGDRIAALAAGLRRGAAHRSRVRIGSGIVGVFIDRMDTAAGGEPVTESAVLAAAEACRPRLERFLSLLSTAITAAPMLGILGTVTGIIQSFGLLGDAETVRDTTAMAAGISEALYTTAFGLTIALVLLLPYNAFRAAAGRCLNALETLGVAAIEGGERDASAQPSSASLSSAKMSSGVEAS